MERIPSYTPCCFHTFGRNASSHNFRCSECLNTADVSSFSLHMVLLVYELVKVLILWPFAVALKAPSMLRMMVVLLHHCNKSYISIKDCNPHIRNKNPQNRWHTKIQSRKRGICWRRHSKQLRWEYETDCEGIGTVELLVEWGHTSTNKTWWCLQFRDSSPLEWEASDFENQLPPQPVTKSKRK